MKRSLTRASRRLSYLFREAFLLPLVAYRRLISPALPPRCRYYPTCSTYGMQAVRELGIARGSIVAAWRVLRCNPWSAGGVDELSERRIFRGRGCAGHNERGVSA